MNVRNALWIGFSIALFGTAPVFAQQIPVQANPVPGCAVTPAQLEATKKVALDFAFLTGEAKVALADSTYIQHNPTQHKRALEEKATDFDSFKKTFAGQAPGGAPGAGGRATTGPQPPPGNRAEIVLVQCDIVTVIHKTNRQDPTEDPGKFYEAFTFDAYRVSNGKVVEHWDDGVINLPTASRAQ